MSNAETPAENTGGTTATPAAGPLADLPARIRVHALAKLLGSSSREVLGKLTELGESVRSAQSSVSREVALRLGEALGVGGTPEETSKTVTSATQPVQQEAPAPAGNESREEGSANRPHVPVFAAPSPVFLPPEPVVEQRPRPAPAEDTPADQQSDEQESAGTDVDGDAEDGEGDGGARRRRRRGRRGRGRGKGGEDGSGEAREDEAGTETGEPGEPAKTMAKDEAGKKDAAKAGSKESGKEAKDKKSEKSDKNDKPGKKDDKDKKDKESDADKDAGDGADAEDGEGSRRRRRRRRRKGGDGDSSDSGEGSTQDDPPNTVVHLRDGKGDGKGESNDKQRDGVRSVRGSTRLEAKRQRRRDGREAGRRRAPILSESEFLARRESVDRTMVVAEKGETTQIGVLEDGVLVEHFVTSAGSGSIVGNVYLGRVQNVLPSMEAAFIDIGRGRNAVLYAGEVDWDAAGLEGKARKIEQALSTGDSVLVQVTKDPVGHKGARLTTQISLPGRFLVYVPAGGATGISRKLPENERRRLKDILKRIVPEDAGVIIRTASEGISEEELGRDVRRLKAQWDVIQEKVSSAGSGSGKKKSGAPTMLYEEPDLLVKVVRDLFTEDFVKLEVQGATAWETINAYVQHVAPDLTERLKRYTGNGDVFADYRIDEQITKALDRKVWLPSGGYLVIDRTEAMTVIDVNTGKFTGSGGNLEETVTRNNLESAEEIVRQLRLRDIGGIIVIDFIDMVLESNRDLVLRRLTECLGRDRTRHQVAEVTSLGLVQMTRKRIGTGLLEAFSSTCEHCKGRGLTVSTEPHRGNGNSQGGGHQHGGSRRSRGRGKGGEESAPAEQRGEAASGPTPEQRESVATAVQAMASASKAAAAKGPDGDGAGTQDVQEQPEQQARNGHHRDQDVPEAAAEPVESVRPVEAGESAATGESAEPVESGEHGESAEPAVPARAPRPTGRRTRRAASRPAGPPVNASDQT
ncbi:translation initiation factor IF-2 N-terminal domain-containing protein [Amycolatopsis aidingensis]|uniref:translation initiation factor IF-2 N-terminal domain-containing protein n=1 Tax=Amycolatopsis aidingensis TaxID=2842453 RepID=UPI001C0D8E5A|nr:translation initiation factor IF-2 N-terminal domain-containing protein [Amycolatopsis aidingensis]